MATVLIQHGSLNRGRYLVSGETWAKVKVMLGEGKSRMDSASLSQPVVLAGWKDVPLIGEDVIEVESEVGGEGDGGGGWGKTGEGRGRWVGGWGE